MPKTPGKRARDDDEENGGLLSFIFSTAKKKRRQDDDVEVSTEATTTSATLPRLNLTSPSSRSPASQPTVTFAVQEAVTVTGVSSPEAPAVDATPVQQPQTQPTMSRTAPSPWRAQPIQFHLGSASPRLPPRRRVYRPNSRTLVPHRRTRRSKNTAYNAKLVQRLLNRDRNAFASDPAFTRTFTTAPGRRQLGTNQSASRLNAASIQKKVSFDETQVAAATPHVPRRQQNGAKPRNATPYVRRTTEATKQQESPAQDKEQKAEEEIHAARVPSPPPSDEVVDIAPLPTDYGAMPRDEETAPFVMTNVNEFADTRPRRGTLVAEPVEPSTLGVTHVPVPPPTVGFLVKEGKKPAAVQVPPPQRDVSPPDDAEKMQPATKRVKPNEGWGDRFKDLDKDTWKCDGCSVRNPLTANVCMACERPRRDGTDTCGGAAAAPAPAALSGSIGEGGFSFKPPAAEGGVSFSFGAGPSAMPQPFSFGATTATSADKAASSGFSFATASATKSEDSLSPKEQSSKKLRFSMESDGGGTTKTSDDAATGTTPAKDSEEKKDTKPAATPFTFETAKSAEEEKKEEESKPSAGTGFSFGSTTAASTTAPAAPSFSFANESKEEPAKKPAVETVTDEDDGEKSKTPSSTFGMQSIAKTEPKPATTGGFTFDTTSSAASTSDSAPAAEAKAPETNLFSFGATKPVTEGSVSTEEKPAEAPADSTAMGPPPNKPSFVFGSTAPPAAPVMMDAPAPSFAAGSTAPSSSTPAAVETPATSLSFGAPATNDGMPQSSFFGGSTPAAAPEQEEGNRKKKRGMDNGDTTSFNGPSSSAVPTTPFTSGSTAPAPATSNAFGGAPSTDMSNVSQFGGSTPVAPSTSTLFGTSTPAAAPGGAKATPQFGSTAAPDPSTGQSFTFGQTQASTPAAPPPSFGGPAASSTPATSSTFGQSQNGGSNPFGASSATQAPAPAMSFGSSSTAAAAPAAPMTFNFGTSSSSQAPTSFGTAALPAASNQQGFTGFGSTPATVGTPAAPFSAPGAPSTTPSFAFGAPTPTTATPATGGFSGGFGSQAPAPAVANGFGGGTSFGGTAPTPNMPTGGGFSIGSGGGGGRSSTGRGRRIVRARRPPGSGR